MSVASGHEQKPRLESHLPTGELPTVSVVIPAFNYAGYLGLAIQSVLRQDHAHFEIIVVDDGSTDHTAELVAGFSDPRIRYIHQENSGLSSARNTGIQSARHDFVAFLDADDEWLPEHLSSMLTLLTKLDPSFALLASASERIDVAGQALSPRRKTWLCEREIPVADIVMKTRFMPSSVLVRRAVFAECGLFDSSLRSSEDRDMWIRIGARHRIFLQGRITVRIRKHSTNMSKQADRMRASMSIVIRRAYATETVPRGHYTFWLKAWALFFFQNAWMLYDAGRRIEAVKDALLALCIWPLPFHAAKLNEPAFFRLRALARFCGGFMLSLDWVHIIRSDTPRSPVPGTGSESPLSVPKPSEIQRHSRKRP